VIGGHVHVPLGPNAEIGLLGDVGGWDATAKVDYQFAVMLGYKVHPKWTLQAGYRYLFIDYRGSNFSVVNLVTSGAVAGVTYRFR
jgi:opacity protein-like surface antigen